MSRSFLPSTRSKRLYILFNPSISRLFINAFIPTYAPLNQQSKTNDREWVGQMKAQTVLCQPSQPPLQQRMLRPTPHHAPTTLHQHLLASLHLLRDPLVAMHDELARALVLLRGELRRLDGVEVIKDGEVEGFEDGLVAFVEVEVGYQLFDGGAFWMGGIAACV